MKTVAPESKVIAETTWPSLAFCGRKLSEFVLLKKLHKERLKYHSGKCMWKDRMLREMQIVEFWVMNNQEECGLHWEYD